MDDLLWDFSEARRRLLDSADYRALGERGHTLRDGAVLTSVSRVPFEMRCKCAGCGTAFWFENMAWSSGGGVEWRLSNHSRGATPEPCSAIAAERHMAGSGRLGLRV
jgi:hypothetical protein